MASIRRRLCAGGAERWQATVRVAGHKQINKTFGSHQEAIVWAEGVAADLGQKRVVVRSTLSPEEKLAVVKATQVGDLIGSWKERGKYSNKYDGSIVPAINHLGHVRVSEFTAKRVEALVEKLKGECSRLEKPYAADSIRAMFQVAYNAVKYECDDQEISRIQLPPTWSSLPRDETAQRERRLDADEEVLLREHFQELGGVKAIHWDCLIGLALETAARLQELVLMEWSEIKGNVWIIPAAHCKTRKSRNVPFSRKAQGLIAVLKSVADVGESRAFHSIVNPHAASNYFSKAVRKVGIEDLHFHDLRHEAISRMVAEKRKLNQLEILKIVGHSSIAMLNRYMHLRGDELVDKMD